MEGCLILSHADGCGMTEGSVLVRIPEELRRGDIHSVDEILSVIPSDMQGGDGDMVLQDLLLLQVTGAVRRDLDLHVSIHSRIAR